MAVAVAPFAGADISIDIPRHLTATQARSSKKSRIDEYIITFQI